MTGILLGSYVAPSCSTNIKAGTRDVTLFDTASRPYNLDNNKSPGRPRKNNLQPSSLNIGCNTLPLTKYLHDGRIAGIWDG